MQAKQLAFLRAAFHRFARVEAPGLDSPTYEELAHGVSMDDDLLEIASHTRSHQPPPNMLFAAVQYLLLSGIDHPLAAHYPIISGESRPPTPALPYFRDFCLRHRDRIVELIATPPHPDQRRTPLHLSPARFRHRLSGSALAPGAHRPGRERGTEPELRPLRL